MKWGILNFPTKKRVKAAQQLVGTGEVNLRKKQRKGSMTGSGEHPESVGEKM